EMRRRALLVLFTVAVAIACTGGNGVKSPADVSSSAAIDMLGGAPDLALSLRPRRMAADAVYGPIVRCAAAPGTATPESHELALAADSIDVWLKDDAPAVEQASLLVVVRGAGRFDPARFKSEKGAEFGPGRPIGAGVVEHSPVAGGAGASAFVVPDGTY